MPTAVSETYELYKANGICVRCRQRSALPDRVLCKECAQERRQYDKTHREQYNAALRHRREARKAAGLCIFCGRPAKDGHTRCSDCLYLHRVKQRIRNLRKSRIAL